jgi:hypothetical protein
MDAFRLEIPKARCGVYHLIRDGVVIYVGQTQNLLARLANHHLYGAADEVEFHPCSAEELDARELADIERLQPAENRAGKRPANYPPGWPRDEFLTERERRLRLMVQTRLTDSLVAEARRRVSAGASVEDIAEELGVSPVTVRHAVCGLSWAHVPEPPVAIGEAARGAA